MADQRATYPVDREWYDLADAARADTDDGRLASLEMVTLLNDALMRIHTSSEEQNRIRSIVDGLQSIAGVTLTESEHPALSDLLAHGYNTTNIGLKYNVFYAIIQTIVSRICSFRPRAQFLPEHGNYKTHALVRDLNSGMDAWAQRERYQDEATEAFRDALYTPGGVLKVYPETVDEIGKVRLMRLPPWELKIDAEDDRYGDPECMYHVRWITIRAAMRLYGITDDARMSIAQGANRLAGIDTYAKLSTRGGRKLVRVSEGYKRGPGGWKVILVGDYVAQLEPYEHERHMFERIVFDRSPQSGWGYSAIQPIRTIQDRVDDWLQSCDDAHHLSAKLVASIPPGATFKLTNDPVILFEAGPTGAQPSFHNPSAIDPGAYHWWEIIKAMAAEILGVPPNAQYGTKAPAVTSAVAIDAVTDIENGRLSRLSQQWEQLVTRVADLWYSCSVDLGAGEGAGDEYLATDRGQARVVKFVEMKRKPVIRAFPTSLFGQSIPARLQRAMDAVKAGWFSQEEILWMLDIPDLDPATRGKLAEFYFAERFVDDLLMGEQYTTPDRWMDPQKLFDYTRRRYLLAVTDGGYPEPALANVRKLLNYLQPIASAAAAKASGQPAPAPAQLAAPAAPALPGAPGAPAAAPLPGLAASPEAQLGGSAPK
jgi:hypothetical protein